MTKIAVYGAGGFGKEVCGLLEAVALKEPGLQFAGFIDDFVVREPVASAGSYDDVVIAIADPEIRQGVFAKLQPAGFSFRNLVHPNVDIHRSVKMGYGIVLCSGVRITIDIRLGNFVIVNLNATIGHDVTIGNFSAVMPSANISGGVNIGENVLIGSGAVILQGLTIGSNATIGAGAVVTRSVADGVTVKGVPAR